VSKIIIALYVLATSSALVILKLAAKTGAPLQLVDGKLHVNLNLYTASGIALYGVSFLIYTFLIAKYDLGYIIPLTTALVYVLIFVASFYVFKEVFTTMKLIGIVFVLVGVAFLNAKS
jgi:drug/metabolite transporter (DMT)-like permease